MNMNELNEEELDMVNGGSIWSTIKKALKTFNAMTIEAANVAIGGVYYVLISNSSW